MHAAHTHGHRDGDTQTHQLPYAIKKREDLLYFTHPRGVNNSLEPKREAAEGDDVVGDGGSGRFT